jgi:signal transduction histidine kinase
MGLIKAVGNEVERINHLTRLDIELAIGGEPVFMECEKELVIFRIIQEAFNNIIKHAQASRVWLTLEYGEEMIEVLIKDNGIGFDKEQVVAQKKKNAGLNNIRTRAKLFKGKLKIESHPNLGTCLIITIPYN